MIRNIPYGQGHISINAVIGAQENVDDAVSLFQTAYNI